ncbi:hypothetical protein OZL92_18865 [Bacillus sonorensis]|nr:MULTISPECIES: hypothetical protein [Bacillus]ASB88958.1 hypothetical protein S101395_02451 [Bacillus sonorensis]MCF7618308.1 hypothetical protein [Bacillus sonorensis]MCY8027046.1 hypothetical protein [Bacillus sonorensis]MCY8034427.1 hypothetical protein [Bacillus sonorensis]MCY8088521.1 hypothetical protein [Bacillus sonorensis]
MVLAKQTRVMTMWNTIVSFLPNWVVIMQAIFVFLIPYAISKFFHWIQIKEDEG